MAVCEWNVLPFRLWVTLPFADLLYLDNPPHYLPLYSDCSPAEKVDLLSLAEKRYL